MAGRPVILHSHFAVSSSSDNTSMGAHSPGVDVLWKCAHISLYQSPWTAEANAANQNGGIVQVRVNGSAVFEAMLQGEIAMARHAHSLVIPWGDGLRFAATDVIDWYIATPWALQGFVNAGFIGTHEPEV